MSRYYHMSMPINTILRCPDYLLGETPKEVRAQRDKLCMLLEKGWSRILFSDLEECEEFDSYMGCPGHELSEKEEVPAFSQPEPSDRTRADGNTQYTMEGVLPELKKGDVLVRSINGISETLTVREVGTGKEFDEPVYLLTGRYGVKLKTAYAIEQLAGMGFKLRDGRSYLCLLVGV